MLLSLLVYQINLFDDGRHFLLGALDLVVHVADDSLRVFAFREKADVVFEQREMGIRGRSSYVFVDSEAIFKSLDDYNAAIKQLDDLSAQYQKNIDEAYATLDQMYETYQSQKGYLSEINRNAREEEIIKREKDIKKYQQEVFGPEGDLIKKRLELIKPIQERVFAAINQYAETNQITMVIDRANNQTLLYYAPALDKTNAIITLLKQ